MKINLDAPLAAANVAAVSLRCNDQTYTFARPKMRDVRAVEELSTPADGERPDAHDARILAHLRGLFTPAPAFLPESMPGRDDDEAYNEASLRVTCIIAVVFTLMAELLSPTRASELAAAATHEQYQAARANQRSA